jgi:hypothetical protein
VNWIHPVHLYSVDFALCLAPFDAANAVLSSILMLTSALPAMLFFATPKRSGWPERRTAWVSRCVESMRWLNQTTKLGPGKVCMAGHESRRLHHHTVGNVGLFYVCYRLSLLGWNTMPTSRNAKGVDIVAYSYDGSCKHTFQVKALSKPTNVGLGKDLLNMIADFFIVCQNVQNDKPDCFILTRTDVVSLAVSHGQGNKKAFWVHTADYDRLEFREKWDRINVLSP